jgi:hypothetical protein
VAPVKKHVTIRLKSPRLIATLHYRAAVLHQSLSAIRLPVEERLLSGIYLPIAVKSFYSESAGDEVGEAVFVTLFMLGRNVFFASAYTAFAELQFSLLTD